MLPKAQFNAAAQRVSAQLPQAAETPVAAPAVSVFAKAKNLLSSVAVNSKTAKLAIGSLVAAAVVYATFKFATTNAKKADEKKKDQKATDFVTTKMYETKAAAGKAYRVLSERASKFKEAHPVAVKVMGAAVAVGALGLTAKLFYKPAAKPFPSSVANAKPNDLCYQGDVIDFDDMTDPNYAHAMMHEHSEAYSAFREFSQEPELDANQQAIRDKFKNDVFYGTASTRQELAECMEKFNRERGQIAIKPEPAPIANVSATTGQVFDAQAANATKVAGMNSFYGVKTPAPVQPQPAAENEGYDNMGQEWTKRLDNHDQLSVLDKFFGLPKGGYLARLEARQAAANRKIEQEANALWKDYAPESTDNDGIDAMIAAHEQGAQLLQQSSDNSWVERIQQNLFSF